MDDRAIVERQLGRPPRAFLRVAVRCPFGAPAVTDQAPYDSAGEPFPTTYYLTCPHLVAAIARHRGGRRASSAGASSPSATNELAADLERGDGRAARHPPRAGGRAGRAGAAAPRSSSASAAPPTRVG